MQRNEITGGKKLRASFQVLSLFELFKDKLFDLFKIRIVVNAHALCTMATQLNSCDVHCIYIKLSKHYFAVFGFYLTC